MMKTTIVLVLGVVGAAMAAWGKQTPTAAEQLESYKNSTSGPGVLRLSYGAPVLRADAENSLFTELGDDLQIIERQGHFNRERIPQRVVHGKGTGAKGYLKVTHDVTHITNAALFSHRGKITPVTARFSAATSDRGSPDTIRSAFSVSAKFFTEEGNWDFLGFTTDIFFIKDALFFTSALHSNFKNPVTNLPDTSTAFDYFLSRPETIPFTLILFGDPGVYASYRNIPAYPIHTFQVENDCGDISYVRWKMTPDAGEAYLNQTEMFAAAGTQSELYTADLYNTIASGKFPTWTLGFQVIPEKEAENVGFNIWDVTMRWSEKKFPFQSIGTVTFNENPKNHFADVEQLAFNPGQLVPGIQGCDQMFRIRTWAYRDAATYRMGPNFNKNEANCPLVDVLNYDRDGAAPVGKNQGGAPNYNPNSYNGPVGVEETRTRTQKCRPYIGPEVTNQYQATEYYEDLPEPSKQRLASNLALYLSQAYPSIQQRAIEAYTAVHPDLGAGIQAGLESLAAANGATSG